MEDCEIWHKAPLVNKPRRVGFATPTLGAIGLRTDSNVLKRMG
jgi:hypothetical protein